MLPFFGTLRIHFFCQHISKWLSGFDCELRLGGRGLKGGRPETGPLWATICFGPFLFARLPGRGEKTFRQLGPLKARGHKFRSHHIFRPSRSAVSPTLFLRFSFIRFPCLFSVSWPTEGGGRGKGPGCTNIFVCQGAKNSQPTRQLRN